MTLQFDTQVYITQKNYNICLTKHLYSTIPTEVVTKQMCKTVGIYNKLVKVHIVHQISQKE